MSLISIDTELCTQDGHCVAECPAKIIEMADDGPFITAELEEKCIDCGHCVAVCPTAALTLKTLSPGDCPPIDRDLNISEAEATQFLRSRRSIRNFKNRQVDRETFQQLIDIARHAPTASNKQPVQWLIVEDPAKVQKIAGLVTDWMREMIVKMPEMAEERNFARIVAAQEAGIDRICRNAPHLVFAFAESANLNAGTDCAIALSYMELLMPPLGLGGCWAGYVTYAARFWPPMKAFLRLPEDTECHGAMLLGYPKYRYHRMPVRREASVIWH